MAMHRQHPDPRPELPASQAPSVLPAATMTHPRSIDMTISEWTADLAGVPLYPGAARTTSSADGFVDFDAVESIHETDRTVRS